MLIKILRALFSPRRAPRRHRSRRAVPNQPFPKQAPRKDKSPSTPKAIDAPPKDARTPALKQVSGKAYVIDGDTITINKIHIRLFGIDAPEMDQPFGKKAKWAMVGLTKGQVVTANLFSGSSYDRVVGHCVLDDGTDLSEELVKQGLALDWAKFSGGAYSEFEPDGVRKKLWRVAAKHKGKLKPGA